MATDTMMEFYDHQEYWDKVAERLSEREKDGRAEFVAGDDTPLYNDQNRRSLEALESWFCSLQSHSSVLEFGCGPGGNLRFLLDRGFSNIEGFDTSRRMLFIGKAPLQWCQTTSVAQISKGSTL
jgi:SAM-dependent methyltransferase